MPSSSEPTVCRLLALPTELLIKIVELSVVEETPITPSRPTSSTTRRYWLSQNLPALAKTCKVLHNEVVPVYFGQNAFCLHYGSTRPEDTSRTLPMQELRDLHNCMSGYAKHLQSVSFRINYIVRFGGWTSKGAGRQFEIRAHKPLYGPLTLQRYSRGGFNPLGMRNSCVDQCCACDLIGFAAECDDQQLDLLEVAEEYYRAAYWATYYGTCDACGLPRNRLEDRWPR